MDKLSLQVTHAHTFLRITQHNYVPLVTNTHIFLRITDHNLQVCRLQTLAHSYTSFNINQTSHTTTIRTRAKQRGQKQVTGVPPVQLGRRRGQRVCSEGVPLSSLQRNYNKDLLASRRNHVVQMQFKLIRNLSNAPQ